jgi:hypothetical protein
MSVSISALVVALTGGALAFIGAPAFGLGDPVARCNKTVAISAIIFVFLRLLEVGVQ